MRYVSAAFVCVRYVVEAVSFVRYLLSAYPTLTICLSPSVPASVTAAPLISPLTITFFVNVLFSANVFSAFIFA